MPKNCMSVFHYLKSPLDVCGNTQSTKELENYLRQNWDFEVPLEATFQTLITQKQLINKLFSSYRKLGKQLTFGVGFK